MSSDADILKLDEASSPKITTSDTVTDPDVVLIPEEVANFVWVPARLHPQLAPHEFQAWLSNYEGKAGPPSPSTVSRKRSLLAPPKDTLSSPTNEVDDAGKSVDIIQHHKEGITPFRDVADGVVSYNEDNVQLKAFIKRRSSLNISKEVEKFELDAMNSTTRPLPGLKRNVRSVQTSSRLRGRRQKAEDHVKCGEGGTPESMFNEILSTPESTPHSLEPSPSPTVSKLVRSNSFDGSLLEKNDVRSSFDSASMDNHNGVAANYGRSPSMVEFHFPTGVSLPLSEKEEGFKLLRTLTTEEMLGGQKPLTPESQRNTDTRKSSWSQWLFGADAGKTVSMKTAKLKKNMEKKKSSESVATPTVTATAGKKATITKLFKSKTKPAKHEKDEKLTTASAEQIAALTAPSTAEGSSEELSNKAPKYTNHQLRYPIHIERVIYRISHIKLTNSRRPLLQQVLISNWMFWYLGLISQQDPRNISAAQRAMEEANSMKTRIGKSKPPKPPMDRSRKGQDLTKSESEDARKNIQFAANNSKKGTKVTTGNEEDEEDDLPLARLKPRTEHTAAVAAPT